MNQPTGRPVGHPLVARYLAELDRLLVGVDPAVRADTLAGVHEHLDAATGGSQDDGRVREALEQLGSPYDVAAEAHGDQVARPAPAPLSSRGWLPVVAGLLLGLALLFVVAGVGSASAVVSSSSVSSSAEPDQVETTVEFAGSVGGVLLGLFAGLPFWVAAVVLIGVSRLWQHREKVALVAAAPAVALVLGVLPALGWALIGEQGVYAGAWIGIALAILALFVVVRLSRRALHRSRALPA